MSKKKTENLTKYGCISKSLVKFLSCKNDEERKKEYGGLKSAKYYERIVKGVNASFLDHLKAIDKLPDEYLKKINFEKHYESLTSKSVMKKWAEHPPDKFLQEVIDNVNLLYHDLQNYSKIRELAKPDFEKLLEWLYVIQEMKKKGIKNL